MDEGLVSVDKFSGGSQVYFLTHLHRDHTRGLDAAGGWRHGPLYCSPVTARLLPTRFPDFDASLLRPLAGGASASLSLSSPSTGRSVSIVVTAIPALHCPGANPTYRTPSQFDRPHSVLLPSGAKSVHCGFAVAFSRAGSLMYLFRGDLGCMLNTGDFRWERGCERARAAKKALLEALAGDTVDVLYLDNTYCHPSLNFPPRPIVAEQMVYIIRAHPDHEIIIGVDTLGKEDLLLHISRELDTKIWVWPQRLQTIHLLGIDNKHEIFTTQTSLTRIRAVPRYSLTIDSLDALNTVCPTIGIMPSGIPWLWKHSEVKAKSDGKSPAKSIECKGLDEGAIEMDYDPRSPPKLFEKDSYTLPYSEHACFAELEDFMQTVRPSTVVGIVSSSFCYVNPRHHFSHLCGDNVCSDKTPVKSKGRDNAILTPKKRKNGSKTPKERKVRISSSSLYRSRVTMKRKECCGAKIKEPE
ncbi:hypothetical protein GUJ93_ZPchr0001g29432 [Zizania palustris]|uniref:DNA repair metallo-beta-lactamase domain-containing protein n=1 Tax=Zizania palustris TaxID=103762 RepID=A0A8J5RSA8_ZIZPA|nr:hypothetical protein GUJ93_ZPchr0001g29432 [Zizania palustris]